MRVERLKTKQAEKNRENRWKEKSKEKKKQNQKRRRMTQSKRAEFYGKTVKWRLRLGGILKKSTAIDLSESERKTLELTRTHGIPRSLNLVSEAVTNMMTDKKKSPMMRWERLGSGCGRCCPCLVILTNRLTQVHYRHYQ